MIGQKLGSYRIEAELGSGAMGVVYRGFNEVKNKAAAVKVISLEQMGKGMASQRFIREAEILEQFRHPNIVRYMGRGRSGGQYYYAMEYITGPTLDKVLRDRETLPWREVVAIGVQLCDALHYSHQRGIVHRDLKPSNLMITESGQLKLTDFGIAKDLDATALTGTGRTLGTATYMAPEQIRGTPEISHKTDLYALGAVFYHLLTGNPPFGGPTALVMMHAHINEPVRHPSDKVQEIPKALDDLVVSLMAKHPQDRPWDAEAVGQVLRELLDKSTRQEPIKMVWAEAGSPASMPNRADILDPTLVRKKSSLKKKKVQEASWKGRFEALGLISALIVVAGLITYVVMPPGAPYLFKKARALMASEAPSDWIRARDEYLDPLDSRFPGNSYRDETAGWRDRIELRDAERRARVLEAINLTGLSQPKTEAEDFYQNTYKEAQAAIHRKDHPQAEKLWRTMAANLPHEGRENRGYILLVGNKAEAVAKESRRRRETVDGLMRQAIIPDQLLDTESARSLSKKVLRDVVDRFGEFVDVSDYVGKARAMLLVLAPPAEAKPPGSPATDPMPRP